jgi:16S rRNA G966 N2-methylase RsmD
VDPPYADTTLRDSVLALLGAPDGPLRDGATVVVTAYWREAPRDGAGLLRSMRVRRFGETAITLYRRDPGGVAAAD